MKTNNLFFVFVVDEKRYGVPVNIVKEIIPYRELTSIPRSPYYISGVLNLRGQVVTVINLKSVFTGEEKRADEGMNVIVVSEGHTYSLFVDDVSDVIELTEDCRKKIPRGKVSNKQKYVKEMYEYENEIILVLDTDHVLQIDHEMDNQLEASYERL
jgi:purine-binding chemotaxis protein CheW